ncbi:hypothetical protein [Actinomycetospora sp. NBRC 106378]|uniref:hypothetical protein n=1 Tax=Actinomycetospora sp. NBRC 106378 TaxID=3032208 RepID=UPI0024A1A81E|nr:hypothetical protein [Actinomycetospora sp. NBRC 106378]GLZ51078.1 hypothetical protein Acsp07_06950 [Actinomycetospora sp. NBRC 106378]
MDDATRALLALWDTTEETVGGLRPADWARPLARTERARACAALDTGGTDVTDLVTHLCGVHYAGPDRLQEELAAAHVRAGRHLTHLAPHGEELAAHCLDMCLHTHDLLAALDRELNRDAAEAAAAAACELVVGVVPRLLAHAPTPRAASLRVVVRTSSGVVVDRVVPTTGHGAPETLEADAVALVLLLSARRGADELGDRVTGSGPTARRVLAVA